jgi:4-amino-4-deoxy-L-arabinose transferase-like glycosyltransferase
MKSYQKYLLVVILLLAVFFRFYQIMYMPGGLFPDEAANGLDINSMQQGDLQPFYERGNGREALFFYFLWASVEIFGKGPWQHHIVSALIGVLSVLFCFLVARRLFVWNRKDEGEVEGGTNIALVASFLMAVSTWHIVLSRTAFRANLIPLFAGATFYFLLATIQAKNMKERYRSAFLTGAMFALGFYSYIAYRMLIPILLILLLWPLFRDRSPRKFFLKHMKTVGVFAAAFVLFMMPLFLYFADHPEAIIGRSGQVSIFNPELNQGDLVGTLIDVVKKSVAAYFTIGDFNWRHNISGLPFLSPLVSPFFAIGLILVTAYAFLYLFRTRQHPELWKFTLLTGWFWGMLIPVVTTAEGIPHGLRSIGTIPVVFIISAWIMYHAWHWADQKLSESSRIFVVFFFCGALVLQSYFNYFVYSAAVPENFYAFRSDLTEVSEYLVNRCERSLEVSGGSTKISTYLVLDKFSIQTPDYMTMVRGRDLQYPCNQPYRQVEPEKVGELTGLRSGDEVVFTQSTIFDIRRFSETHPDARTLSVNRNQFGEISWAVFYIP